MKFTIKFQNLGLSAIIALTFAVKSAIAINPFPLKSTQSLQNLTFQTSSADFSHKLYGISKSLGRTLGLDSSNVDDIDDGTEKLFRENAAYFFVFGLIFIWIAYQSLTSINRK